MALLKFIKLSNGVELNYHIVDLIESTDEETSVVIQSFGDEKFYKKALEKETLLNEQKKLVLEFDNLYSKIEDKENINKTQKNKLDKLQEKINKLAEDINNSKDFSNYVLFESIININKLEDLSLESVERELLNSTMFENASIV